MERLREHHAKCALRAFAAECARVSRDAAAEGARRARKAAARTVRHEKRGSIVAKERVRRGLRAEVKSAQAKAEQRRVRSAFRAGADGAAFSPRGGERAWREKTAASLDRKRARSRYGRVGQ